MLPSKSRSGFMELGKKSRKSALLRTISASRFCRGNPLISQIDAAALKPLDRKHSHGTNSPLAVNQVTEELKMTKALLEMAEQEKERALDKLQEMKMGIQASKQIDSLLEEKDMLIDGLEVELSIFKASRSVITESLCESKRKIKELENEIEKIKGCENDSEKLENMANDIALEEREKMKREMENLVLELNEARTEANSTKEKLLLKEVEMEKVKEEAEQNAKLLNEVKKENERLKNTMERLRLEADESHLAWNEREIGFVNCVKDAEEERKCTQQENNYLMESLKSANSTVDMFREENLKLKAVLKQATGIANIESSLQLKSTHVENDEGLEYRKLSVKELNRPFIVASVKDLKTDSKKQGAKTKSMKMLFDESRKGKSPKNRLSFDLSELKKANIHENVTSKAGDHEVPVKADLETRSIFDIVDTPKLLTRRVSLSFLNGKTGVNTEDCNDSENSWIQKRKAFLQTFEDLIKGRSVEQGEKSVG